MAKKNIYFNGKDYSIDDSALVSAKDSLKTHLSTTMAGSGGSLEPITWDGVIGDKIHFVIEFGDLTFTYVKISDKTLSVNDFIGSVMTTNKGEVINITSENILPDQQPPGCNAFLEFIISVYDTNSASNILGIEITETGTYFVSTFTTGMYVNSLTFPASSGSGGATPITFDGTTYQVDPTKLATVTDDFVAHLETLKGGGLEPITWDGVPSDDVSQFRLPEAFELYKVSDQVPTESELIGSMLGTEGAMHQITADALQAGEGGIHIYGYLAVIYEPTEINGWSVEPGTYFGYHGITNKPLITALTFPGASSGPKFEVGETVTFKESYTMDDIPEEYWPAEGEEYKDTNLFSDVTHIGNFLMTVAGGGIIIALQETNEQRPYNYMNDIGKSFLESLTGATAGDYYSGPGWYTPKDFGNDTEAVFTSIPPSLTLEDQETAEELAKFPFLFSSGGGNTKLTINGTEYLVDSSKLSNTITELQNHLETLSNL